MSNKTSLPFTKPVEAIKRTKLKQELLSDALDSIDGRKRQIDQKKHTLSLYPKLLSVFVNPFDRRCHGTNKSAGVTIPN